MTSVTFFFIFIPIISIILLGVNLILAPHNPYQEKDSVFECGFHSFLGQNRTQFNISFFIFGLLFLLFDLEILLVYPYIVSAYVNDIYGLMIMLIFFLLLTLGFAFELGKNALKIDSRQNISLLRNKYNFNKKVNHKHLKILHSSVKKFLLFSAILHNNGSMSIYIIDPKIVLDYIYSIIPSINIPSINAPIFKSCIYEYKIPIYTSKIGILENPMLHNSLYISTKMVIFNISNNNIHSSIWSNFLHYEFLINNRIYLLMPFIGIFCYSILPKINKYAYRYFDYFDNLLSNTFSHLRNLYVYVNTNNTTLIDLQNQLNTHISDINRLFTQVSTFITQFNTFVRDNHINIILDSDGNLSIDVSSDVDDETSRQYANRIQIMDRLIHSHIGNIQTEIQLASSIEEQIIAIDPDPNFSRQVPNIIDRLKITIKSYPHYLDK